QRFERRFGAMERSARAAGTPLESLTLEQLDALWEQAKAEE
ncbi:MAG: nucleoside triphosphate pyrophosphohydrolase, partial [Chloroflexi bacterium]|nr:nucleoside triphosphate pyrophosphohydrolase [Chloroflexota bacterium]